MEDCFTHIRAAIGTRETKKTHCAANKENGPAITVTSPVVLSQLMVFNGVEI